MNEEKQLNAEFIDYKELQKKVLVLESLVNGILNGGSINTNIPEVIPDQGSVNGSFQEGKAGAVALYNRSSGLRYDELTDNNGKSYGKRLQIAAATEEEINAGISMNNPIVPGRFAYALSNFLPQITPEVVQSFIKGGVIGDFSDGTEGMYPVAGNDIRKYIESVVGKLGLEVAVEVFTKNQVWEMPPSTLAVVAPYKATFTGTDNENGNSTHTINLTDVTVLFSTGKVNNENVMDSGSDCYRCMAIYKGTLTYSSSHKRYKLGSIKITNTDAGNMYVYYLRFNKS